MSRADSVFAGHRYGQGGCLEAVSIVRRTRRGSVWLVRCHLCGREREYLATVLRKRVKACGCLQEAHREDWWAKYGHLTNNVTESDFDRLAAAARRHFYKVANENR